MQSIGWTLVHSLWQGLAVYVLLKIGMRLTPRADVRYGMGVAALALIVVCSALTFSMLNVGSTTAFNIIIDVKATATEQRASIVQVILSWIDTNIVWLLRFWVLGLAAGLLRIAAGLWYINRLRRGSSPVQDEWNNLVKGLSTTLNITRAVTMAEAAIASPMVVGFVKPMILFPVGLLAGLTTDQVETILLHELSHIRRQDYIINLVQSVIETIFFFNPFVLLISSLIREERENCCDDLVIAKGISPISYVKTLAQLEAARSSSALALGIAGNQNQLLNRMKRIMENSAKNDWGRGRLVPVALLFLGLICASWLSISPEKKEQAVKVAQGNVDNVLFVSDTSKEDGLKVLKKRNHGWVLEEPAEPAEPGWPAEMPAEFFEMPAIPDFEELAKISGDFEMPIGPEAFAAPEMDFDVWREMPQMPALDFDVFDTGDSIPGYRFRIRDGEEWESFEKEFREKFKSQFKEFYQKNQKQFDRMLDDMMENRGEARMKREAAEVVDLHNMLRQKEEMQARYGADAAVLMDKLSAMSAKEHAKQALTQQELARISADRNLEILNDQLLRSKEMYEAMSRRYEIFNKALVEQLVADGYMKAGENIEQLNINDNNGTMIINGKSIKEKDRIKYQALQDKYLKTDHIRMIPGRSE
jgi:bla regulator protein BlaR1